MEANRAHLLKSIKTDEKSLQLLTSQLAANGKTLYDLEEQVVQQIMDGKLR